MDQKLDTKAIVAIVLCVAFIVFYQPILKMLGYGKFLEPPRRAPVATTDTSRGGPAPGAPALPGPNAAAPGTPAASGALASGGGNASSPPSLGVFHPVQAQLERTIEVETPLYHARFSSRGARLVAVELKRYASAHGASSRHGRAKRYPRGAEVEPGDRVTLAGGPLFGLDLGSGDGLHSLANVVFAESESLDAAGSVRTVTFTHQDSSGFFVRQTFRVRPDTYAIDYETELRGVPAAWRVSDYSLTARSWPLLTEGDLLSDARGLRATSLVGSNIHREHAAGLVKGAKRFDGNATWAVVQSRYFMCGAVVQQAVAHGVISSAERKDLLPEELAALPPGAKAQQEIAINSLALGLPSDLHPTNRFELYVGPCEYKRVAALKIGLERAVDLGWNWLLPFSTFLLKVLNWLEIVVHNYGLAILLLATLVRVLLHPLNMTSMKSMRAMQKLQPEIERLKKKYDKDPTAMNTAMMALYKENKVNPAGGCLPMLIQMPMFIALYQVLFNAIELRQAPFIGWMHDLSAPDLLFMVGPFPIRLLPILMTGSGLLQQALTPSDPQQKPTMYMMNVMMLVFFYNLPSGLVLYWTVMNLLTALQQWLAMRQDGDSPVAQPVAVAAGASGGRKR